MPAEEVGIAHMPGYDERIERAQRLLAAARAAGVPVVFFQEVHRPSGVDFGRELDGTEGVHCVEGQAGHRSASRAAAEPRPTNSTSSNGATPVSSERISRSCCRG